MNEISTIVENQRKQFLAVASTEVNFDREAQFVMQIFNANEYLMGVAMKNKNSLIAAVNNVAAVGITLNPASKLAYLVPRKQAICLDISYMGLMHIAQSTGAIKWGQAEIVRENDTFTLQGIDKPPMHHFNPFNRERGKIIGCYVVVKTDTNDYLTHSMPIDDIFAIRDRSEAWKTKKVGPWATDEGEMIKKTVVKQASKYWPRRERLDSAVHYLNDVSNEGINFENEASQKAVHSVAGESLAALDANDQDRAREVAETAIRLLDEGFEWAAHDKVYSEDDEMIMAIWAVIGNRKRELAGHKVPINYRSTLTDLHAAEMEGKRSETDENYQGNISN